VAEVAGLTCPRVTLVSGWDDELELADELELPDELDGELPGELHDATVMTPRVSPATKNERLRRRCLIKFLPE
jgi:hypothetical protein